MPFAPAKPAPHTVNLTAIHLEILQLLGCASRYRFQLQKRAELLVNGCAVPAHVAGVSDSALAVIDARCLALRLTMAADQLRGVL